ncbi:MAG TPA: hypothetical protein VKA60_26255 [Blastocatellia bacterium]|nr:hypothetical protein [Blastocatellia bacterium]
MRKLWLLHLTLYAALAFVAAACRNAKPQTSEDQLRAGSAEAVEDSGRRLAGDFVVQALADDYGSKPVQAAPRWTFSLKEDGSFRSERILGSTTRAEAGSYLISVQGELVFYIETVGGETLSEAHVEHYRIEAQSESELKLRRDRSTTLVLRKK